MRAAATRHALSAMMLAAAVSVPAWAQNWPAFRGPDASGVGAAATPPVSWDLGAARNVAWKTRIPGLAHSSPIVWGDRIYVTTAVPSITSRMEPRWSVRYQ